MSKLIIDPFRFAAPAGFNPGLLAGLQIAFDIEDSVLNTTGSLIDQWNGAYGTTWNATATGNERPCQPGQACLRTLVASRNRKTAQMACRRCLSSDTLCGDAKF